jgi:hypothetical protein
LDEQTNRWALDNRSFLARIYQAFEQEGDWPARAVLQRQLVREGEFINVSQLAVDLPPQLGHREAPPEERIVLHLLALRYVDAARPMLEQFIRVLRLAADRYQSDEDDLLIRRQDLTEALGLSNDEATRLSRVLLRDARFLGGGPMEIDDWQRPIHDAGLVDFLKVEDIDTYLATEAQLLQARRPGAAPTASPDHQELPASKVAQPSFDVFICHASEDKEGVARPLATALKERGLNVWIDEFQLTMGDSLRRKIDEGLRSSRFGVVILSPSFFQKSWPQWELDGLVDRELSSSDKVVLPVWHEVDHEDVAQYSLSLAEKLAARTSDGIKRVADEVERAFQTPATAAGAQTALTATSQVSRAKLDATAWPRGNGYTLQITNIGEIPVENIECVIPEEVPNWHLQTEALPTYPLTKLNPGDSVPVPFIVTMAGPGSQVTVEATLKGSVDGEPYERRMFISVL